MHEQPNVAGDQSCKEPLQLLYVIEVLKYANYVLDQYGACHTAAAINYLHPVMTLKLHSNHHVGQVQTRRAH